ncbi:MAG: hypothetical protein ACYTGJ_12835 [Planctomycetota bacterium]|jgi:hypothetical protein
MAMERIRRLFGGKEIPVEARDILARATTPQEMLGGLDELITRNELEIDRIHREIEALEAVEEREKSRVREGDLPDRSRNNTLRRIGRLRKQMDNLEERLRIFNRNINLQHHLVGKVQALGAMELRGLDEERIDAILLEYEEELGHYSSVLESEDLATSPLPHGLDDAAELRAIEAEILGSVPSVTESAVGVPAAHAKTAPRPSPPVAASGARVEAVASSPTSSPTSSPEEGAEA